MTYPGLSMWDGLSKTYYFIDLSVGGCGGHLFYFEPNPRVVSQMSIANEHTDTFFIA